MNIFSLKGTEQTNRQTRKLKLVNIELYHTVIKL